MKVFEKINELKGTDASCDEIYQWAYMNRILPYEFESELDLGDIEYPNQLKQLANSVASDEIGLRLFLTSEYNTGGK